MTETVRLLVGYDGSQCGAAAIDDLRRAGLPLDQVDAIVLSIADVRPELPGPEFAKLYPEAAERARLRTEEAMAEAQAFSTEGRDRLMRLFAGWQAGAEVATDSPYWGLIKKAQDWPADLLVVGSRGRSVGRILFGSVSQHAVLYADCAVRIGRCRTGQPGSSGAPVRILVGWDGSPDAELAIRAASRRQWPPGSEGRLVTGLDARLENGLLAVASTAAMGDTAVQDDRELLIQQARAASEKLRVGGLMVGDPVMRRGDPKRVILEEAEAWQANCIFVGAKGLSRIERVLLGSVSSAVASRAECSVEVVRSRHPE
jgi:nucleotide-binding universal stress UspA family protein